MVVERLFVLKFAIALMCIAFAHFLGRSIARKPPRGRRGLSTPSWALRTLLAAGALAWPSGINWFAATAYALAAVSAALGYFLASRPKKFDEDLTRRMFPGG
jgi:hypothetical protein